MQKRMENIMDLLITLSRSSELDIDYLSMRYSWECNYFREERNGIDHNEGDRAIEDKIGTPPTKVGRCDDNSSTNKYLMIWDGCICAKFCWAIVLSLKKNSRLRVNFPNDYFLIA